MIKISSGNAAFDLGFMHEMRMQGWTKKQANVILDYMLQHGSLEAMEKSASVGLIPEDPESNPLSYMKWAASARERYAWCKSAAATDQQQAPATTGSIEGDAQAGQQAAKQGGGFFSKLWNGVKNVGSFLGNAALTAGTMGVGGFGPAGGFGGMGGVGMGMSPIAGMAGRALGGLSSTLKNVKVPGISGAVLRGLGSIGNTVFGSGGGGNATPAS